MSTISQNNIVVNYVITSDQIAKTKTEFDKLTDAEKKAVDETKKLNDQLKKTGQEGGKSVKGVGTEMNNLSGIVKSGAGLLAGFFALSSIKAFTERIIETTIKFEGYTKAIEFGSGSAENFARNQEFLTNLINKYGLGLAQTTDAYKSFFNASTLAGQSQQETNRQFEAVTKAGTVLKLTTDQMQGAFLALGQMMSKGTVQAEELRGQLGERIPGAFSIMAQALGVNEKQLNKMLEQGQVLSKDALPKFAAELEKTFGPKAEQNLNGMVNSQNRFNNSIDKLILAVGDKLEPFLKGAYDLAAGIATQLASVGQAAKKETVENIALKKTESDLAKKILDVSIQQGVWIDRKRAASELLLELDTKITNQEKENTNNKIRASGSLNNQAAIDLKNGLDKLAILNQEEVLLSEIAGIIIKGGGKKKELTDAELKALKAQYDAKLRLLELDKRIADIQIEVSTEREDERNLKLLRNAADFGKKKLAITKEYAALQVQQAEEDAKIQVFIVKKQEHEITAELKKQREEREKARADYEKKLADDEADSAKKLLKIRNDAEDARADYESKIIKKQQKVREDAEEARTKYEKKLAEDRQEIIEKSFDLAVSTTNSLFELQSQYAANDFARKQKQFDEEIRLADGNVQKITEIEEKRREAEKQYREKEFKANQMQAIANVIFNTAPIIAKYAAGVVTAPLAIIAAASAAAQIGFILAQPIPEFAEGTKGKKYKGRAIVGEQGTEKVVTQSGRVYYTPAVATLAQFDEPVEIIPNHQLGLNDRKQLSLIYGNRSTTSDSGGKIIEKLSNIEIGLKNMPVAAISLDERGFMKKVRTPNRSTTILNNRFKN